MQKIIVAFAVASVGTEAIRLESSSNSRFGFKQLAGLAGNAALTMAPPGVA